MSSNVLSNEIIKFWKYLVAHELYAEMYVKMAKIRLCKKCPAFGTNEDISMEIWQNNFKASNYVM